VNGCVALVTGASRGIGAATARRLASDGYAVAVGFSSAEERAAEVVGKIRADGGVAESFRVDLSEPEAAAELPELVTSALGPPLVVVNNAGVQRSGSMRRMSDSDWELMWSTNVRGAWSVTRSALPAMYAEGWGRVVFVSSVLGATGGPGDTAYSSTKAALLGMSKSLALEAAPRGVTSNAVLPGTIETDLVGQVDPEVLRMNIAMTAQGRPGRPEEVAAAIAFLCSSEASYVSGAEISVHGGGWLTLPPSS
jgi:NAD(P)-dependent dehydrogenase (short-subunit alcohol dehydrogenase family)